VEARAFEATTKSRLLWSYKKHCSREQAKKKGRRKKRKRKRKETRKNETGVATTSREHGQKGVCPGAGREGGRQKLGKTSGGHSET